MRTLRTIVSAAAIAACLAPSAGAQDPNSYKKTTFLTFSGPVSMPGMTLAAGTYKLELADPDASRNIISVASQDGKERYGLFLTIPDRKIEPSSEPVVMFSEKPAGTAQAVRVWYYPGQTTGYEFVYPKTQAIAIAKANNTSVLASDTEESSSASKVERIDASGEIASAGTNANNTSMTAQNNTSADPPSVGTTGQMARNETTQRTELPRTASQLALFQLLSAVSLTAAWGVRRLRRRR
jgi:hypothetical protein